MQRGCFITFEGGEGAGKSTQGRRLADRIRALGRSVELTREPGGPPQSEILRELLIQGVADRWSPVSETLLMYAAREEHLRRLIRPALQEGRWVISDRFHDSTRAYQGAGGGAPIQLIDQLESAIVGAAGPDLTLVMDLPVELGLERAAARSRMDRFEHMSRDFHERLRAGFLDIARANPDRCVVIDAAASPDEVAAAVWTAVEARLPVASA